MERLRSIEVSISVDTNKATYDKKLVMGEFNEDETRDEFIERVKETINNNLPD